MLNKVLAKFLLALTAIVVVYHEDLLAQAAITCNPNAVYQVNHNGHIYNLKGCTTDSKSTHCSMHVFMD